MAKQNTNKVVISQCGVEATFRMSDKELRKLRVYSQSTRQEKEQGFLEKANVEVVTEMVNMIEVNRLFEAYQKVMQTSDTLDRAANEKIGKRIG